MPNIDFGVRDGGSYAEDVFFARVENSGASRDWWVETIAWSTLHKQLLSMDFNSAADSDRLRELLRSLDRDLPAEVEARFPDSIGVPGAPGFRRLLFYRLPPKVKGLFDQMRAATPDDSLFYMSVASLDTADLQVYNQSKFESEFCLTWYLHPTLLAAASSTSQNVEVQLRSEISRLCGELDARVSEKISLQKGFELAVAEKSRLQAESGLLKDEKNRLEMELESTRVELDRRNGEMAKLREEIDELQKRYDAVKKNAEVKDPVAMTPASSQGEESDLPTNNSSTNATDQGRPSKSHFLDWLKRMKR